MLELMLERCYEAMDGSEAAMNYSRRHGVNSAAILTVHDDESAAAVAAWVADRIAGKTVVEIGGGIGLLAFHLSLYAKQVFVIEANPVWTSVYVAMLHEQKPKNVTFIFGAAEEMSGQLRADVALFCTHSDKSGMTKAARLFSDEVIDVYGEVIASGMPLSESQRQAVDLRNAQ